MQRVRIGITGLAVVFLVVLLAAAMVGFHKQPEGSGSDSTGIANGSEAPPADPLAELGVAPGGTASDSAATQSNTAQR